MVKRSRRRRKLIANDFKLTPPAVLARAGGFGGIIGNTVAGLALPADSAKSVRAHCKHVKESQRDVSGSRVQIFGRVRLNFKTDLLPLAGPGT